MEIETSLDRESLWQLGWETLTPIVVSEAKSKPEKADRQSLSAEVVDEGETIGVVLRTKLGVKPVYVSIGHKVDLETAIHWVLELLPWLSFTGANSAGSSGGWR